MSNDNFWYERREFLLNDALFMNAYELYYRRDCTLEEVKDLLITKLLEIKKYLTKSLIECEKQRCINYVIPPELNKLKEG